MTSDREPAQRAYEAYSGATGGHSLITGDSLPEWGELPQAIQEAWRAAAAAVPESPEGPVTFADGG